MKMFIAYTKKDVLTRMSDYSLDHLKGLLHRDKSFKGKSYSLKEVEVTGDNNTLSTKLFKDHGVYTVDE